MNGNRGGKGVRLIIIVPAGLLLWRAGQEVDRLARDVQTLLGVENSSGLNPKSAPPASV
jgi:hypothetical protein